MLGSHFLYYSFPAALVLEISLWTLVVVFKEYSHLAWWCKHLHTLKLFQSRNSSHHLRRKDQRLCILFQVFMPLQLTKLLHFYAWLLDIGGLHNAFNTVWVLTSRLLPISFRNWFEWQTLFNGINYYSSLTRRTIWVANAFRIYIMFAFLSIFAIFLNLLDDLMR